MEVVNFLGPFSSSCPGNLSQLTVISILYYTHFRHIHKSKLLASIYDDGAEKGEKE